MALTRPDLKINNTVNDQCTAFTLSDTTGTYPTATSGYDAPSTILKTDVTGLIITIKNLSTGNYFTYTFTVLMQVTQTCTLSLGTGTPVSIQTAVGPLAFPFITSVNEFNPWTNYGVTLPDFADGVYEVDYRITGASTRGGAPESFDYITSQTFLVDCDIECCIDKLYASLDTDCSCSDAKQKNADQAWTMLQTARFAAELGDNIKAIADLAKSQALCDCNCGCD